MLPRALAILLAALSVTACTRRFYRGPDLPSDEVVVLHVGGTSILEFDGRYAFTKAGTNRLEIAPGPHRVVLAFDRPATTIGMRDVPALRGPGKCTIDFVAKPGKQYWLGTNAIGTDWTMRNWDGKWEGWVRDPSVAEDGGTVARCTPRPVSERVPLPPDALAAKKAADAVPQPAPAKIAAPVSPPAAAPLPVKAIASPSSAMNDQRNSIRVGTWDLGRHSGSKGAYYEATAALLDENFDVVTLTEETSANGQHSYTQLLKALGSSWRGSTTGVRTPGGVESYSVLYRPELIRPCPGSENLRYLAIDKMVAARSGRSVTSACFEPTVLDLPSETESAGSRAPFLLRIRTPPTSP